MMLLKNSYAQSGLFSKLILLIFIVFFGVLVSGAAMAIAEKFNLYPLQSPDSLLLMQAITVVFIFIVPAFVVAYLCSDDVGNFLFFKKKSQFFEITAVIGILIIALPFINLLTALNESLEKVPILYKLFGATEESHRAAAEQMIGANFWGALAVVALLAAIAEELMFRGAVLRIFSEKVNIHAAVWLSAAIFALIHFQFFGIVPRMVLGAYFAYIVIFSRNIMLSVYVHFFNNAAIIIVQHFSKNQASTELLDSFGGGSTWIAGIISGILAIFGTVYLVTYWKKTANNTD